MIGSGDNAKLKIDSLILNEWTNKNPINSPTKRYGHGMASIYGTDKIIIFGGYDHTNYFDETWIYDLSDNTWFQKWTVNKPVARYATIMAQVHGDDKVVLFGGYRFSERMCNDTWVYDLSENSWTPKSLTKGPSLRIGSGMENIYGTDQVLLFGGQGWTDLNDTWIYDLSDDTWTQQITDNEPTGRYGSVMAAVFNDDKIILFGGSFNYGIIGDTWVYDVSDNNWTQKSPIKTPGHRYGPSLAAVYGDDKAVLFGGYPSLTFYDDTWIYDLSEDNWTEKAQTIKPIARSGHKMATIYKTSQMLFFGGWSYGPNVYNDTWIYNNSLLTKNGTYISKPYDTGTNSSFNQLSCHATTPENTNITFQLRSANNDLILNTTSFVGPDGTTATYYTSSPGNIWSGHDGDRWIQYKAYFNISILTNSPTLDEVEITYNCLPETIIVSPGDGSLLAKNKPVFIWTFVDLDSDQQKAFQVLISNDIAFQNVTYDSGEQITPKQSWEFSMGTNYTDLPDGKWYWKVRTMDGDGAWTNYSIPWSFSIDAHVPSSAPTMPINNGFYHHMDTISGIATDPTNGSGIIRVEINIKDLRNNFYWDGSNWVALPTWLLASGTINWTYDTSTIPWESGTRYSVRSRAVDLATNTELPDINIIFTIDEDRPNSNIVVPLDDNWVNELNTISGKAIDMGGSGINKVEITIKCIRDENIWDDSPVENDYWNGKAWTSAEVWLIANGTNQWSYDTSTIPWSTGNHYLIRSKASDIIGNMEAPSPGIMFKFDSSAPEQLAIYINNGEDFTRNSEVNISLFAADFGSDCAQMALSIDGTNWRDWEEFNITRILELPSGDGEKKIHFKVVDHAGNIAESVSDTIILDTTPPEALSIVINEDAEYTNSNTVELSLNAFDSLSGISDMALSYDGITWLPWEPFKETITFSFPTDDSDGKKNIFLKIIDSAGNTAKPVRDSIILDTTPPESLSLVINDGANETNSTWVILKLNAMDGLSGVQEISMSFDNETWSEWENYTELMSYIIPSGDGNKIVYFMAKDKAGNIAGPITSAIILNTTTPDHEVQSQKTPASSGLDFWMIMFIIATIIFIIIIARMVVIIKRKKHTHQKLLLSGALTIRPDGLISPVVTAEQMTKAIEQPQLPSVTGVTKSQGMSAVTASEQVTVPMLAKSTPSTITTTAAQQTTGQQPTTAPLPQPLPALPPPNTQEEKPGSNSTKQNSILIQNNVGKKI